MESHDLEYDSVADPRVAVSDEEDDYFAADDVVEDAASAAGVTSTGAVQAGAAAGVTGKSARASGHQVSGWVYDNELVTEGYFTVDPRLQTVASAGVMNPEPPDFLSAFSRRFLPSFLQQAQPQTVQMSTDVANRPAERPTEVSSRRVTTPTTSLGPGASFDLREQSVQREPSRSRPAALSTRAEPVTTRSTRITRILDLCHPIRPFRCSSCPRSNRLKFISRALLAHRMSRGASAPPTISRVA